MLRPSDLASKSRTIKYVIGIDPSQRSLGVGMVSYPGAVPLDMTLIQQADNGDDWQIRAVSMAQSAVLYVRYLLGSDERAAKETSTVIVVECPNNWFTEKGQSAKDGESVQKLYLTTGAILGMLHSIEGVDSVWATIPSQWKGQTPKPIMMLRLRKWLEEHHRSPRRDVVHDAGEAVLLAKAAAQRIVTNPMTGQTLIPNWSLIRVAGQFDRGQRTITPYL